MQDLHKKSAKHVFGACLGGIILIFVFLIFPIAHASTITKTIGGSSPDFSTINDAVTWLNAQDDGGPITNAYVFNIRAGTYNERITLSAINGASATNTITFHSESGVKTDVILAAPAPTSDTNNFALRIISAHYYTIENMTLQSILSNDYGTIVAISGNATHNTFLNNIFNGKTSFTGPTVFFTHIDSRNANNDLRIENNQFNNGGYGIIAYSYSSDMTNALIRGNTFTNQTDTVINYAGQNGMVIDNNTITGLDYHYGIYMDGDNLSMKIINNKIHKAGGNGIVYMNRSSATSGQASLIANNVVYVGNVSAQSGITVIGPYNNVYHNSVYMDNPGVPAFKIEDASPTGTQVKNNIFYNAQGPAYDAQGGSFVSDYNLLYSGGSTIGKWFSSPVSTFTNWKSTTSQEQHSVSANPNFISTTNLTPTIGETNGTAVVITAISELATDNLGTTRSNSSPDIGAIEYSYTPPPTSFTIAASATSSTSGATNVTETVVVTPLTPIPDEGKVTMAFPSAFSLAAVSNSDVTVSNNTQIQGTTKQVVNNTVSLTLDAGSPTSTITDPFTVTVAKLGNPSIPGVYGLNVQTFSAVNALLDSGISALGIDNNLSINAVISEALILNIPNTSVLLHADPSVNNGHDASQYTALVTSTNAQNGYRIYASLENGHLMNGSSYIPSGAGVNTLGVMAQNAAYSNSTAVTPDVILSSSSSPLTSQGSDIGTTSTTNQQYHTIYYDLHVDYTIPAGTYTGRIVYTAVASF